MKTVLYTLAFVFCTGLYAQESEPIDKQEETTTKVTKIKKNGKVVKENKVKVVTRKEKRVQSKIDSSHYENSNRTKTPVKVSQKVMFDNDNDPFYDGSREVQYFNYNGTSYAFEPNEKGFSMNDTSTSDKTNWGQARLSQSKRFYVVDMGQHSGVGYFNKKGSFVVEYYDSSQDALVIETFSSSEM